MLKKPLFWGLIVFILSLLGWVVSIVLNVLTLGAFREVSNILGVLALMSLPVAMILHFLKKKDSRSKKEV